MLIKLKINNVCALLLEDFNDTNKQSLAIMLDGEYTHEWSGDAWFGPGAVEVNVAIILMKTYMINTKDVFSEKSIYIFLIIQKAI